jgi:MFS transporter, DHA3 family, macrolide efflux protein
MNKNPVLLIVGRSTSKLGDTIFDYINTVLISSLGSKASMLMAIYRSSDIISNVIFNMIGGVYSDNHNRKKILIITDFLASLACFILGFTFSSNKNIYLIIVVNIFLAVLFSFNSPTYRSIIPDLVEKKHILKLNSVSNIIDEVISVGAPMLGVVITTFFSFRGGMLLNGLTFLLSAVCNILLSDYKFDSDKKNNRKILKEIRSGISYIFKDINLFTLILVATFVNFFLSGFNTIIPFANRLFTQSDFGNLYAVTLVAQSIGSIIGALGNGLIKKFEIKYIVYSLFVSGFSLVIFGVFVQYQLLILSLLMLLLFAMFITIFNIRFMTYVQMNTEKDYLGRVFSIIFTLSIVLMPAGAFVFSSLLYFKWIIYLVLGLGVILTTIIGALFLKN